MKTLTLLLGISLLFCLNSCSQDFKKLPESDVNKVNLEIAQNFAESCLTKLKEGSYYTFQDEGIDALKNLLTEEKQKSVYNQLKSQFGDFQDLEYAETWIQGSDNSVQVYRFKSNFDQSSKKLEVRVVINEAGKIAGFWIKPWSDMLM